MIALLGAELQRITSRRLTRVFFILLVAGFSIALFQSILREPSAREPFLLGKEGSDLPGVIGLMVGFLSIVLGASAFGADTGCGALATQLTWEPRRVRVLGARAFSVALVAATLCAVTTVFAFASATIATSISPYTSTAGMDGAWWSDRVAETAVATGGAAGCAVAGMALAVVMWNSTGPIVVVGAMSIVGEPLLANWNTLPQGLRDRLPLSSLLGLASTGELGGQRLPMLGIAAVAWALGLLIVAGISFSRREVR